jgi:hypothetical protein
VQIAVNHYGSDLLPGKRVKGLGKRIVFLNLADMHEHGLAKTSATALRLKYQRYHWLYEKVCGANQVQQVDLFDLLRHQQHPRRIRCLQDLMPYVWALQRKIALTDLLRTADKIMLGVHGRFDDTETGFAGLGWDQGNGPIGTVNEFADLLASLLLPGSSYKVALIVCFGARSQNFRKDHTGALSRVDIESSFAFKFYRRIYRKANVTMTARTGSVSFDTSTGRSLVQTEAAVQAEADDAVIQAADETKRVARDYKQLRKFLMTKEREGQQIFFDMEERFDSNINAGARNPAERIVKRHAQIVHQVSELQAAKAADVPKYGKFVYKSIGSRIQVYRKYSASGEPVMQLLYDQTPSP